MKNYNQKTLDHLRGLLEPLQRVEQSNAFSGRKHDLFGIIDYLGVHHTGILVGIQSTSYKQLTPHKDKMIENPNTIKWLNGRDRLLYIIAWEQKQFVAKKSGKTYARFVPRTYRVFTPDKRTIHFQEVPSTEVDLELVM